MEKKVKKGRGLRVFIALGVMCMLLMGLAVQAGADRLGSRWNCTTG